MARTKLIARWLRGIIPRTQRYLLAKIDEHDDALDAMDANGASSGHATSLTLPKEAGTGILVDLDAPTHPWQDLYGPIRPKPGGGLAPTLATFRGGQYQAYAFGAGEVCDLEFHLTHDYVDGTDLFVHVHWAHNGTAISGELVLDWFVTYAKGYGQTTFPAEKQLTQTIPTPDIATIPQYAHQVMGIQLSAVTPNASQLDTDDLEPQGLILVRLRATTIPTITGGSPNEPFLFFADVVYRTAGVGTKQPTPDFWA